VVGASREGEEWERGNQVILLVNYQVTKYEL
jgi:hypothetical protein